MNETFGKRLQRLRKQSNLTQEQVATKLNITFQAVSKWENDVSAPDISLLGDLADILNVSLDELLGRERPTKYVPQEQRKDIDKMFLHLRVNDGGDRVEINLPIAVIKVFTDSGMDIPIATDKISLKDIDFKQIYALVQSGVVGKIVDVTGADGEKVEIWVD